jgi:xanthine dehydrogenase molybdopterin-binding subunit B
MRRICGGRDLRTSSGCAVQAKNAELARRTAKLSEDDYEQLRVEFEERLAAAERKAYALAKERDALRRGTEKLNSVNELLKVLATLIRFPRSQHSHACYLE